MSKSIFFNIRSGAAFVAVVVLFAFLLFAGCSGDGATTFKLKIEANPKGGGALTPTGTIKYSVGTDAEVTATAKDGYIFTGWSGASDSKHATVSVTMTSNQTLTANFQKIIFTSGTFTDSRDSKKYSTVKIGNKMWWMAENLNFQADNSWCYGNNEDNCQKYGRLYDWNTAMKACPAGWRLPTREDWQKLINIVGDNACTKLRSKTFWYGTDDFTFSALPGGGRLNDGSFIHAGREGIWWIATEDDVSDAWKVYMRGGADVGVAASTKRYGFSVRCTKGSVGKAR